MPQISDRERIRKELEKDRPWAAYALADLEPGYFENTSWFCDDEGTGLTLLYRGYSRPLLFCIDESGHFEAVLNEIDRYLDSPERYIVLRPQSLPLIRKKYRIRDERPMIRMTLNAQQYRPVSYQGAVRLGPGHLHALKGLYRAEPPEFFLDPMLTDGIYFGIYEENDLVAVAGTHIISPNYHVGGLGNIYTRADRRARGYSTRVTGAVSHELIEMRTSTIVLNVREENTAAIRVYDRLGYQKYCRYFEAVVSAL
jgi:ribosomal protein S18 acetylase RimI-like enzyme